MRTMYRQVVLALLGLQLVATLLLLFILISTGAQAQPVIAAGCALIICTVLLLAYWRGQEWARYANVVAITLLTGFGLNEAGIMRLVSLIVLVPPALALVLTPPLWMLSSAVVLLAILIGCAATITGISADVAMAFTQLGTTFDDVATARSPQDALALYAAQPATE